jgi:hypothetical protein
MGEILAAAAVGAGIFAAGVLAGVRLIKNWEGWK